VNKPAPSSDGKLIWIVVGIVVVVAGVAALLVARNSTESDAGDQTASVQVGSSDEATETSLGEQPSQALPPFDANVADDPAVGMTIPTVDGVDFEGEAVSIAPGGDAKVLLFVAHWCPHCQREVPRIQAYLDENPLPEGVELITVSTGVRPDGDNYPPSEWLAREGWQAPVLVDDDQGTVAATYGLSAFPYFVAVDSDGKVVARASGELSTEDFAALVDVAQQGAGGSASDPG
jgi:thiol-disulfide isomerase/thioredoxin